MPSTMEALRTMHQEVTQGPDLSRSVVLIRLEQHSFGNSRKLRKSQYSVEGGDQSMTSASRRLLDSPELERTNARMASLRKYVQDQSLPFPIDGVYMMPLPKVEDVVFKIDQLIEDIENAVTEFMATYRTREQEAKQRNPGLYDPSDYPPEAEVRRKFSCYYNIVSIGVPEQQLKDRVDPAILKKARQSSERLWVDAAEMTRQMQAQIMFEMVENLRDKLTDDDATGKPRRFTNAIIDNLNDFMRNFEKSMNVTDYKQLEALVKQGRALLNGTTLEDLKDSAKLRAKIKSDFAVIEKALVPMVGERKVRSADEF